MSKHIHTSECAHTSKNCNHTTNAGKCSCGHNHSHEQIASQQANTKSCCNHDNFSKDCPEPSDDDGDHAPQQKSSLNSGCGGDCGCSNEHSHDEPIKKANVIMLGLASLLFIGALVVPNELIKIIFYLASVLLAGYDLFKNGLNMLFRLKFEENVLLLIAVVASFALGEYPEACIVTILFKLGSIIESSAIRRSKKSMEKLTQIRPDFATIMDNNNELIRVEAKQVQIGEIIYLRAGDKVALDCEILEGSSSVDSSALTGESIPIAVGSGDELLSGSVNLSGLLKCRATKSFEKSTASQIIELVYESSQKKGKTESFISRLAKVYTPIVIVLAILIAVVPPLLGFGTFHDFIMRSLIFLVASCPCALVISIPLGFFASIGAVSKQGILVKGSMYIESLSKVNAIALDKTGTLTSGNLSVDEILTFDEISKETVASYAFSMESYSTHPIATAITSSLSYARRLALHDVEEIAGLGLLASHNGQRVICGGSNLLKQQGIDTNNFPSASVYICIDSKVVGAVTMKEDIPQSSLSLKKSLSRVGVDRVVMLTGDNEKSAKKVADQCGITEYYSALLPKDKVERVESMKADGNIVLFVGDGINDAPVLTTADLGVSMGLGSEIANVSSDVVLSSNNLKSLPRAIELSKRSMRVVYFNIAFALFIKIAVLILGAVGLASMWLAVFADIGVTILTVLNAIRVLRFKPKV